MSVNPDPTALPDELIVTLRKPIVDGDQTYTELRLREPTAAELLNWDQLSGTAADIQAVSIVAGVPKRVVEKVGARDLIQGARYIAAFLS